MSSAKDRSEMAAKPCPVCGGKVGIYGSSVSAAVGRGVCCQHYGLGCHYKTFGKKTMHAAIVNHNSNTNQLYLKERERRRELVRKLRALVAQWYKGGLTGKKLKDLADEYEVTE